MAPSPQIRALEALTALLTDLECMSPSHLGDAVPKKEVSAKIEALLQDAHPFAAMEPLRSVVEALDQYQNLCGLIERELRFGILLQAREYAEKVAPLACKWLGFIHPMNGNVTRSEKTRDYQHTTFVIVNATSGMVFLPRNDHSLVRFLDTTKFIVYNIDILAHFFRYNRFSPAPLAGSAVSNLLFLYDLPMAGAHARTESRKMLSREMARVFGKHPRRLCRVISRYADVLNSSQPAELDAQCMLFTAANTLLNVKELRPYTCPRRVVAKLVAVIDRRSRGPAPACKAAVAGCTYLDHLWRVTQDNRTLQWSLFDGILHPILRIMTTYAAPHEFHETLRPIVQTLYRSFIHYRVLLAFNRMHANDPALRAAAASITPFAALAEVCTARYRLLDIARKDWNLKSRWCHNTECPGQRLLQERRLPCCECRRVFYCSRVCQRTHWLAVHQKDCDVYEDFICKTGPRDTHLMNIIASDYVRTHRHNIVAEVRRRLREVDEKRKTIKFQYQAIANVIDVDFQIRVNFLGPSLHHTVDNLMSGVYGTEGQNVFISGLWMEGEKEKSDCLRVIPYEKFNEETLETITMYAPKDAFGTSS
ncbi:hypothetical protein BD626DRAFT_634556 [Schizophyllum amplum]|uniref:MYND-type domain-containing protein n=1 Tax=Schizophyllum amplum TaxID=97359 RepID=A0A550BZ76_9AGAR|nr:hypothetical protein BD626DRAFT_634556 [Auriculariopsis ampla]